MADERGDEGLERVLNELSESVLTLPSEDILAESTEVGSDPQQQSDRTRLVLRKAAQMFEQVHKRLSERGHAVNPRAWRSGREGYQNLCLNCHAMLTFALVAGDVQGPAVDTRCPARNFRTIFQTGSRS